MSTTHRFFPSVAIVLAVAVPLAAPASSATVPLGPSPATSTSTPGATPAADRAAPAWRSLAAAELEVERSCDRHQRVRPCREADGSDGFQCVASSPLAAVLHWFEADRDAASRAGDEIRVEVRRDIVREADEVHREVRQQAGAAASAAARDDAAQSAADATTVVVVEAARRDRPLCRPGRRALASTP